MNDVRRELIKLLWHIPEDDIASLAEAVANSFIDELDLTERRRIDSMIEGKLKKHLGPAASRWAVKALQEIRNEQSGVVDDGGGGIDDPGGVHSG